MIRRNATCRLAVTGTALLLAAGGFAPALAIVQTGEIEVLATDPSGSPLDEVLVVLTGTGLPGSREGVTDESGSLVFLALPPGRYVLDLQREGHRRTVQRDVVVHAGRTVSLRPVLPPGDLSETVTVTAKPPLIDSVRTSSLHTYDRDFLDRALVGLGDRNLIAPLVSAPGVTAGADPRVRGSGPLENVFMVDGADIGNPDPLRAVSTAGPVFEAIEEIQFQTGAMGAEFGRTTGGVANVVTRSGGNEFSGSLDLRYSDANMLGSGEHFDPEAIGYRRAFTEASVGGPFVRDKLWFFAALGDYRLQDAPEGSKATASGDGRSYLGKLTWQVNRDHKLSVLFTDSAQEVDNYNTSSLVVASALGHSESGNRLTNMEYLGLLGPRLILQAQAAWFDADWEERPQSGDTTTRASVDHFTGRSLGNFGAVDTRERTRRQVSGSATWSLGKHTLKGGLDLQKVTAGRSQIFNGGGWDRVVADATGRIVPLLAYDITSSSVYQNDATINGAYVSDRFRFADRWTANFGIRYDDHTYENDVGVVAYDAGVWQPRLGVAWDVTGDSSNVVKVTWGRFGQPTNLNALYYVNENHLGFEVYANESVGGYFAGLGPQPLDLNGDGTISDRLLVGALQGESSVYAQNGRLDPTYVDELTASYERRIGRVSAVGITGVIRRTDDLIEDYYPDADGTLVVIENLPGLERKYDGIEVRYEARFRRVFAVASYTLARSEGSLGLQTSWGCSTEYDFPVHRTNRWGYLPGDARHSFKLNGFWTLPLGFEIGYAAFARSGSAYTVLRPTVPYDYEYPEGRGSRRLPSFEQIDLELRKSFNVGSAVIRLNATVLNVLDSETITAVNPLEGALGEPLGYQKPRRFELGMHVGF